MRKEKILKIAKGYRGRNKNCITIAARRVEKGLEHAYRDRKRKKREMRQMWILQMGAACKEHNLKYSRFIHYQTKANVQLNRKVLGDIAQTEPFSFKAIVDVLNLVETQNPTPDPLPYRKRIENLEEFIKIVQEDKLIVKSKTRKRRPWQDEFFKDY